MLWGCGSGTVNNLVGNRGGEIVSTGGERGQDDDI